MLDRIRHREWLLQPEWVLVGTFAGLTIIGTLLLKLPAAAAQDPLTWLEALFTATSAVCVTGLIVRDTATELSRFGQTVVLVLIQLGGLGLMTFAALGFQLLRRRLPVTSHAAIQEMYFQGGHHGSLFGAARKILLLTLGLEALGAVLIYIGLTQHEHTLGGWYDAIFLSVSAFCNAGFSIFSDSLITARDRPLVWGPIMVLIVAGGFGYVVWLEIFRRLWRLFRGRRADPLRWTLHTRLVLVATPLLIGAGWVGLLLTGLEPTEDSRLALLRDALFQSVTTRTAGFSTVDIAALPVPALMLMIPLMFIGAAPGSCAGGVKITTAAVWLARVKARMQGYDDVALFRREMPHELVRRAALILALAVLWNAGGIFLLALLEPVGDTLTLLDLSFEQISAFATVGLSTGITAELTAWGQLWICLSMFVGRLGPLTIALIVIKAQRRRLVNFPRESMMVG